MRGLTLLSLALVTLATSAAEALPIGPPPSYGTERIEFTTRVLNLEWAGGYLHRAHPTTLSGVFAGATDAPSARWYGEIPRRLQGDPLTDERHFITIAAEYADSTAAKAWIDANFNGDLTDDPPVSLATYPLQDGARSFLADLAWSTGTGPSTYSVTWKIRVILEPVSAGNPKPRFRVQHIFGQVGSIAIGGRGHDVVLVDGSADGIYSSASLDGMYIDLDDDHHLDIDPMSDGFCPFAVPFQLGRQRYEAVDVDPLGRSVTLRRFGSGDSISRARVGQLVPTLVYQDADAGQSMLVLPAGRPVVVYFWASWCPSCRGQAAGVEVLYRTYAPLGLEVLGVSYDTDRAAMQAFRTQNNAVWPCSFSGRIPPEDPLGRLFVEPGVGVFYLIGAQGVLDGAYYSVEDLRQRLEGLLGSPAGGPSASSSR